MTATNVSTLPVKQNIFAKFAQRFSIDEGKLTEVLKATAFKQRADSPPVTDEQMMALLVVADQYGLNPFTKEIYAYPDKQNGIVPVVGVDGWSRIINQNDMLEGIEFRYSESGAQHKGKTTHDWIECLITRKDRSKPVVVREYFDEVVRNVSFATPWDTHPKRMHRHKTLIQCARVAFGFAGIYDEDEAQRIVEKDITSETTVVEGGGESRQPDPEPTFLTEATFKELEKKYRKSIEEGKKSPDDFYAWVESKGSKMTKDQKDEVANWTKQPNIIEGEAKEIDDPFVTQMNAAEAKQGDAQ
jgi:phage recombination protein Bet